MIVAVVAIGVIEFFAYLIRTSGLLPDLFPTISLLAPIGTEGIIGFVGAGVAAAATLLGLYYATVGVVASTVYKDVPGELRDLFVRERSGETYISALTFTLSGGLVVLALGAIGYSVSGITIIVLALFAVFTTVLLVVLGQKLFGFFDPSALSRSLPERFINAVMEATGDRTRASDTRQRAAHQEADAILGLYQQIAEFISTAKLRDAKAPIRVSRQLLLLVDGYSAWKAGIPSSSAWWAKTSRHVNWLTMDWMHLRSSKAVGSGYPSNPVPDDLWVEHRIAAA